MTITCYLYTIPGCGGDRRIAVFATNHKDAAQYVEGFFRGGKFLHEFTSGTVTNIANYAVTEAAELEIRSRQNDE